MGGMDPGPALYTFRIDGHLGANDGDETRDGKAHVQEARGDRDGDELTENRSPAKSYEPRKVDSMLPSAPFAELGRLGDG